MKKKKKFLVGLSIVIALITIALSGCVEEGTFHESFILYVGKERQITETNYSLILKDAINPYSGDGIAFIEIYNNSEYATEKIFTKEWDSEEKRFEIENLKIVLDEVPQKGAAKVSIYHI